MKELVRLRNNDRVAGYRRREGTLFFFSPDMYSWNGKTITGTSEDSYCGARDRNNRFLFTGDIVNYNDKGNIITCEIIHDEQIGKFFLFDMKSEELFSFDRIIKERDTVTELEWVSYTFIQEGL